MQTNKKTRAKKTYKLLTSKITVTYEDQVFDDNGEYLYGIQRNRLNNIEVHVSTKDVDGNDLSEEFIESTLRHELFHVILGMLYFDVTENETIIEWLSNATLMLNKQGLSI
jgi:hypothetical protein